MNKFWDKTMVENLDSILTVWYLVNKSKNTFSCSAKVSNMSEMLTLTKSWFLLSQAAYGTSSFPLNMRNKERQRMG